MKDQNQNPPGGATQAGNAELPPGKQPLHLPADYGSRRNPHYNVQVALYSLLLSASNLSEHFEKCPGFEERQKKLESLVKDYLDTCDPLNTKTHQSS